MATLYDMLGLDPAELFETDEELNQEIEAQTPFSHGLEGMVSTDILKPDHSFLEEEEIKLEDIPDRNALLDMLGQAVWHGVDTAAFGVPGLIAEKVSPGISEEYLTPETGLGTFGAGVGGLVGFVAGAPMKVGAKAATALAQPIIRKKIAKEFAETGIKGMTHKEMVEKSI